MVHEVLIGMYQIRNTIGSGGFAKVKLAYHCITGDKVAIKVMNKAALGKDLPRVRTEIEAMKVLNHNHICRLYQLYENEENVYIILEHCQGGELFDYIVARDKLPEEEARVVFRQIVSAVAYIHQEGFAHRDLKPENILLDEDKNIKLIDFGLCAKPDGGLENALTTCCGSPAYAAPELILGRSYIGSQVDLWSLGVLLYTLLCGFLPFDDSNLNMLYKRILSGKYICPRWLSKESSDLLRGMLQVDSVKRYTVQQVMAHPWLNKTFHYPINVGPSFKRDVIDEDCITEMSVHYGIAKQDLKVRVSKWQYDYMTSTYLLLLKKKERGRPIRLIRNYVLNSGWQQTEDSQVGTPLRTSDYSKHTSGNRSTGKQKKKQKDDDDDDGYRASLKYCTPVKGKPKCAQTLFFDTEEKASAIRQNSLEGTSKEKRPEEENRKPLEEKKENFPFVRPRTPKAKPRPVTTLGAPSAKENASVAPHVSTPRPPRTGQMDRFFPPLNPLSPSRSFDSQLHSMSNAVKGRSVESAQQPSISMDDNVNHLLHRNDETPSRPKSGGLAASVFGSIERSMDKLIGMLTPKKNQNFPRMVKSMNNISGICQKTPGDLIADIESALTQMDATFKRNGYVLRCKASRGKDKVKFDMEIVTLKSSFVGICRKRVKGSSWVYKTLCEDLLLKLRLV